MKKIFGALLIMLPMYQDVSAASYTNNGIDYTWTCYNADCAGGNQYISQYQVYVNASATGVDYKAQQVGQYSSTDDQLTVLGLYSNSLLSQYLNESSAIVTSSSGVSFSYNASGNNSLPDHSLLFGSEDKNNGQGLNLAGLNVTNEWLNIHFNYASGKSLNDFLNSAMFSPNHYIFVHLQGTSAVNGLGGNSQKWKLTWTGHEGGTDPNCLPGLCPNDVPEPNVIALLGIGLLGLGVQLRNRNINA